MTHARTEHHEYVFDNANPNSTEQHRCLSAAYDSITTSRLASTGVTDGWKCLDLGSGGGSVAHWLAERVTPSGTVLATDLNPAKISEHPTLTIAEHDIVTDPLPKAGFDLILARLVLQHIPEREAVLPKLVDALAPGGWLQIDEFDTSYGPVLLAPSAADARLYEKFLGTKRALMRAAGGDPEWGRRAARSMRSAGLVDIDPQPHTAARHAESADLALQLHHTHHLREALIEAGMTAVELERLRALMRDPSFRACSHPIYSVQGRKQQ